MDEELVGPYELISTLGQGAAGVVYQARHRETGDPVAIKLLHAKVSTDVDLQKRFVREASVLERLNHPNIVGHRDCGIEDSKLYLAMELVGSRTLRTVLKKQGTLPWQEAVGVAIQVCRALAHAHKQGVIHRDLKPANLFLSDDGDVKVGDFGLARDLLKNRLTIEGQTVGTCRFMAPEQVQGKAELTGAVDLYALGCLLFQMVSGNPPFDGATIVEVFEKHLFNEPPSLLEVAPESPPSLADVVSHLLAKDPKRRPADADRARELLESVRDGKPLPNLPGPSGRGQSSRGRGAKPNEGESGESGGGGSAWGFAGVLLAVGLAVAGFFLLYRG